jgi:PAS domain S-box-containing protein
VQAEERFRSLVQNSADVITIVDAEGTILYDSPAVERVLGYKPEERVGTNAFGYIGPSELVQVTRVLEELLDSPGPRLTEEMWWSHKDGSFRYLEVTPTNLLEDPAVRGILINWPDITERKEAEEALRESEERFRSTFDEASGQRLCQRPDLHRRRGSRNELAYVRGLRPLSQCALLQPGTY